MDFFRSASDLEPKIIRKTITPITGINTIDLVLDTLKIKKQALIFVSTRNKAEALAEKISKVVKAHGFYEKELTELSKAIKEVLSSPTKQCERLAACVRYGIAFHHSGLAAKQRELVENAFREGKIKIIVSTPTLAYGLNLPAFRVIIRDLRRYTPNWGSTWIPVLEFHQFAGRAGRPGLEEFGEAIAVASTKEEKERIIHHYIFGHPERITSKLAAEPVFRTYLLALISTGLTETKQQIIDFFLSTFYAHTYGDKNYIKTQIDKALNLLQEWEFIIGDSFYRPTLIGKRVSELYLDPLTAYRFIIAIKRSNAKYLTPFSLLLATTHSIEAQPLLNVRVKEIEELKLMAYDRESEIISDMPSSYDPEYSFFISAFKTALMLEDWIEEAGEEEILEKYGARPGDLFSKIEIEDWLLYAISELARLLDNKTLEKEARKLRVRLKYGIKEELLQLVELKGIGRKYARRLYNNGFTSISKLKHATPDQLYNIIKRKDIVNQLIEQLNIETSQSSLK